MRLREYFLGLPRLVDSHAGRTTVLILELSSVTHDGRHRCPGASDLYGAGSWQLRRDVNDGLAAHRIGRPPVTGNIAPLMNEAALDARKM